MTPAPTPEAAELAGKLTAAQRIDLTERWDQFCDCDALSGNRDQDEYTADLLLDGFAELHAVTDDDLEDPFVWERGIEPGGMVYHLTPLGRSLRALLLKDQSHG